MELILFHSSPSPRLSPATSLSCFKDKTISCPTSTAAGFEANQHCTRELREIGSYLYNV